MISLHLQLLKIVHVFYKYREQPLLKCGAKLGGNLPKNCSRSLAIDKLVFIFSCSRWARSHTSPRPPQH